MRLISALIPLLTLTSPALADGSIIVAPIYSQLVAVPVPAGFKAGFENERQGSYILELTPAGETLDQWTQLITVTGEKGGAAQMTATDMAASIGRGYQDACPTSFAARSLPVPKVRGAAEVFAGYLGCGSVKGVSEAMVFLVIKGTSEVYTVQWAERGTAQDEPLDVNPVVWRQRADALALTRICDKVSGEVAPYPSCTAN